MANDTDTNPDAGGTYIVQDGKRVLVEGSRTEVKPVAVDPATGQRSEITEDKE